MSLVNDAGHFAVLTFPLGQFPANNAHLFIYRKGVKIGEVAVTGERLDVNVIADIVSGSVEKGDEVRDN